MLCFHGYGWLWHKVFEGSQQNCGELTSKMDISQLVKSSVVPGNCLKTKILKKKDTSYTFANQLKADVGYLRLTMSRDWPSSHLQTAIGAIGDVDCLPLIVFFLTLMI
jgi:hypothetical protein